MLSYFSYMNEKGWVLKIMCSWMKDWKKIKRKKKAFHWIFRDHSLCEKSYRKSWFINGILCRSSEEYQGRFETWDIISQWLPWRWSDIVNRYWLQWWESFLKKYGSLLSKLNFMGFDPAFLLYSLFSEYTYEGFWSHIFVLGN